MNRIYKNLLFNSYSVVIYHIQSWHNTPIYLFQITLLFRNVGLLIKHIYIIHEFGWFDEMRIYRVMSIHYRVMSILIKHIYIIHEFGWFDEMRIYSDVNTLQSDVNTLHSDANTLHSDANTLHSDANTQQSDALFAYVKFVACHEIGFHVHPIYWPVSLSACYVSFHLVYHITAILCYDDTTYISTRQNIDIQL